MRRRELLPPNALAWRQRDSVRSYSHSRQSDGRWNNAAWNRGWNSTMHALLLLRDLGLDPASEVARHAAGRPCATT